MTTYDNRTPQVVLIKNEQVLKNVDILMVGLGLIFIFNRNVKIL